ncbi:MAG TPA: hypothetical protein DDY12_00030, partial [Porphyromonadaceae bacterium]|nr:hypothetical protein [Porphyromonadaceae bacterium]
VIGGSAADYSVKLVALGYAIGLIYDFTAAWLPGLTGNDRLRCSRYLIGNDETHAKARLHRATGGDAAVFHPLFKIAILADCHHGITNLRNFYRFSRKLQSRSVFLQTIAII